MKKQNILFVSPVVNFPITNGISNIIYNRLKQLYKHNKYNLYLLIIYRKNQDITGIKKLSKLCTKIWTYRVRKIHIFKSVISYLLYDRRPLQVIIYDDKSINKKINSILKEYNFQFVDFFTLRLFSKHLLFQNSKIILDMIDLLSINFKRRSANTNSLVLKNLYQIESIRLKKYEINSQKKASEIVLVSDTENTITGNNINFIENCVDASQFKEKSNIKRNNKLRIIFSGNMSYEPNIQAVNWFIENCFKDIITEIKNAQFVICGAYPSKYIRSLESSNITVLGFVPSIEKEIQESFVAIAPMISGSGMQTKILESMSCGTPVVTTSLGLGGIKAKNNKEIIVRDDPKSFSLAILNLYMNKELYSSVSKLSRNFVVNHHSWENHIKKFLEIIKN